MTEYSIGTVTVTNGSTDVVGVGTAWSSDVIFVGDAFQSADGRLYGIAAVNGATQLTLSRPYGGNTAAGEEYDVFATRHTGRVLNTSVKDLIIDIGAKVDPLPAWQLAREAEIGALEASKNQLENLRNTGPALIDAGVSGNSGGRVFFADGKSGSYSEILIKMPMNSTNGSCIASIQVSAFPSKFIDLCFGRYGTQASQIMRDSKDPSTTYTTSREIIDGQSYLVATISSSGVFTHPVVSVDVSAGGVNHVSSQVPVTIDFIV